MLWAVAPIRAKEISYNNNFGNDFNNVRALVRADQTHMMRHLSGWMDAGFKGTLWPPDRHRLSVPRVCVWVCVLTSSQTVIGGEGRSAPSGLPIRTLTSINISASFLYRSGLSRSSRPLSLTHCISSPSHTRSITCQELQYLLSPQPWWFTALQCLNSFFSWVHDEVTRRTQHLSGCLHDKPQWCFFYISTFPLHGHTWYFHNEEFHGASGWPETEKSCLFSCMQAKEWGG